MHSLWTKSPERRPFGWLMVHILEDIHVQHDLRAISWGATGPAGATTNIQSYLDTKLQTSVIWTSNDRYIMAYDQVNVSLFHTMVLARHAEYCSTSSHRISSGYRHPCTCGGAHYKALHTIRGKCFHWLTHWLAYTVLQNNWLFVVFYKHWREWRLANSVLSSSDLKFLSGSLCILHHHVNKTISSDINPSLIAGLNKISFCRPVWH